MTAVEYAVVGEWLCGSAGSCTCGTQGGAYGHGRGCGLEPIAKVADLLTAEAKLAGVEAVVAKPDDVQEWETVVDQVERVAIVRADRVLKALRGEGQ